MFKILMFTIELFFLFFLSFVHCQRHYAFIETLFVIDQAYFPQLTSMSYEEYVQVIVDTANIVFQSHNDLDVRIEVINSKIVFLSVIQPVAQEPERYAPALQQQIPDYDQYDSIVLLNYQPWEGKGGAQGYAKLKGVCDPQYKILYLLPAQNAGFYLAHELGHQFGLSHQLVTPCNTLAMMSVMTTTHTTSYEKARWTTCENQWINSHICEFTCVFNKPAAYQINENKFSTLPGQRMANDQQAKMAWPTDQAIGEQKSLTYMPSNSNSRCLYLRVYTGQPNGAYQTELTPMLPGSDCGDNAICHRDKCVSRTDLDPSVLAPQITNEYQELKQFCSAGANVNDLKSSNQDPHPPEECVNWEDEMLCEPSRECPAAKAEDFYSLYTRHVCCKKCGDKVAFVTAFSNRARQITISNSILFVNVFTFFLFFLNKS